MIAPKKFKICRRVGDRIFPQCQSPRFQTAAPVKGKGKRGGNKSDFGTQLTEKQKIRFAYGITERQFSNYVTAAREKRGSNTIELLYRSLEMRLDNVVYRLGFAASRRAARQMVSHGHITINGKRVTIPSYHVDTKEVIGVREGSKGSSLFGNMNEKLKEHRSPEWLLTKSDVLTGEVLGAPSPSEMSASGLNLHAIVEFYSR
ncbi:MAG: 30S ribosomal protein S4 [Patescibacteria group bacterium]